MVNIIKLDWDGIAYDIARKRLNKIKSFYVVTAYQIFESPSGDGYHVYVQLCVNITVPSSYKLRQRWKDDGQRVIMDALFRPENVPHDILFTKKMVDGLELKERLIEGWTR